MIRSVAEFMEWQHQLRIYWGVRRRYWRLGPEGLCRWLYSCNVHGARELNLETPTSFCDKLNWLKFHYQPPEFKIFADKLAVRAYVEAQLGPGWLNPLLGVYARPEDIPWDDLPQAFVLKATHGSAMNILCPDQAQLDRGLAVRRLRRWLRRDFYWYGMEWCYQGLPRRIICEEYMKGDDGQPPCDYKVLCFGGKPRIIWVDIGRFTRHRRAYYDTDWNRMACGSSWFENAEEDFPRPQRLDEMLAAAQKLAGRHPFMRVDFYLVSGRLVFGEITLYAGGGFEPFEPLSFDDIVGSWIPLPEGAVPSAAKM